MVIYKTLQVIWRSMFLTISPYVVPKYLGLEASDKTSEAKDSYQFWGPSGLESCVALAAVYMTSLIGS